MEGIELVCFKMISALGAAKSSFMEAIQEAKLGNFDKARNCIEEGDPVTLSLLLVHAEDQLMSAEFLKITAEEIIALYERLEAIK